MVDKKRSSIHAPAVIIAFLCLIVCCAVVSFVGPRSRENRVVASALPVLSVARRISVADCRDVRFSSSCRHFLVLREGFADVYSAAGNKLYSAELLPGSTAVLSANGDYMLAFRERNPVDARIEFLDSTGARVWGMNVDGAVWCADSCARDQGARFVVGTSRGFVYVIDLMGKSRRYRRWRMPGAVVSIAAEPDQDGVYAASWQDSFVRRAGINGRTRWQVEMGPAELHCVRPLSKSVGVAVFSEPLDPRDSGSYTVFGARGESLMSGELCQGKNARIVTAPNGEFACLGLSKMIRHKRASMLERHAQLLGRSGGLVWEKGSPFFCAVPIAVTDKGCAIISDGKTGVFLVSQSGEMRTSLKLSSPVRECFASRDGKTLLALCEDNRLALIKVAQQ